MIRLPRLTSTSVLAVLMPLVLASQGFGQSLVGGQSALDNAAAAGARSPGNMVSAGVGQHIDFGNHVTVITEPGSSNEGLLAQTIASSLEVLFQQLNQALVVFQNLLLARAGRPPALSGITLKAARTEEPRPGNLVNTAQRQVKARRSLR